MNPIITIVAPNGARKTIKDHPKLPVTPEAIGIAASECAEAGANIIHMHIRDKNQKHTLDVPTYRATIKEIRKRCGDSIIIQVTSEAVDMYTPMQQMQAMRDLEPEACSIALREISPDEKYDEKAGVFFHDLLKMGTMPQYILYSPAEVIRFARLRKAGVIPGKKVFLLFVLGKKTGVPEAADPKTAWAKPEDLDKFIECFDKGLVLSETEWAICAFGGNELACMEYAVKCGGHPRIGFENNQLLKDGTVASSNTSLIKQFSESVKGGTRKMADTDLVRKLLKDTASA
jgi:3-keto-5-aminohexanoate cleavage enzyme